MTHCQLHYELSSDDECLLVRKCNLLALLDGTHRRNQTCVANQGIYYNIYVRRCSTLRYGIFASIDLDRVVGQSFAQCGVVSLVGNNYAIHTKLYGLMCQLLPSVVCCEGNDLETVGILTNYVECLYAYRASRAEYGNSLFHC